MAYTVGVTQHRGKIVFMLVTHGDSLERLKKNDPLIVEGNLLNMAIRLDPPTPLLLQDVDFVLAYEPDAEKFAEIAKANAQTSLKLLQYLGRGWENKPEDSDEITQIATTSEPGPIN